MRLNPHARARCGDRRLSCVPQRDNYLNSWIHDAILGCVKASITEAKNRLSALIDGLKGGASVPIVDRGRPVARLEPVAGARETDPSGPTVSACSRRHRSAEPRFRAAGVVHGSAAVSKGRGVGGQRLAGRPPRGPVKFWDASAIVPLPVAETSTRRLRAFFD
jgi:antitoxin (DNA-binding transcriptional repressor) of toxin-antitoxin stability system